MFFRNLRLRFFGLVGLTVSKMEKNQYWKKEHNQHSSMFKVLG